MSNPFKMNFDTSAALEPATALLPIDPRPVWPSFEAFLKAPIQLTTQGGRPKDFDVVAELAEFSIPTDAERPVLNIHFKREGWDRLAWLWLTATSEQLKKDPKSVPRSLRMFANLMSKLPEHATGNGAIDTSRRVVLDRAITQLIEPVRSELLRRARSYKAL